MTALSKCFLKKRKQREAIKIKIMEIQKVIKFQQIKHRPEIKFKKVRKILWTTCSRKKIKIEVHSSGDRSCLFKLQLYIINRARVLRNSMITRNVRKMIINYAFCTIETPIRSYVYHPFYLSPNYEQLEYSAHYFNQAKKLKIVKSNSYQVSEEYLPKFLIQQIQTDKMNFIKTKEFIFLGRSNTGKSALINSLFNDKSIARVSRNSGTTKFLHFHSAKLKGENLLLADSPGYGFANMNKARRFMWAGLVDEYLKISSRLSQIFLCINFQHGIKQSDIYTLQHITKYNVNIQIILCKADKVKEKMYLPHLKSINESIRRLELPNINDRIIACSMKTKFGMDVLKCRVVECLEKTKARNIDKNEHLLIEYLKDLRVQRKDRSIPERTLSKPHVVRKLIYNSKLTKFLI